MATKFEDVWDEVDEVLDNAKAIAFDGCHKIYILLDHNQVDEMLRYGYGVDSDSYLIYASGSDKEEMLKTLKSWYKDSCGLKFIQSVESVQEGEDPNLGFENVIPQGYEEEFCVVCGDFGTDYENYCADCAEENYFTYEEEIEDEEESE